MKTLIIGAGQVGTALKDILSPHHEVFIRDVVANYNSQADVLHICYPDHDGFEKTTKEYIDFYKPKLTIINSSVRVGTTLKCGMNVVYSPVRGRHPHLKEEMKKFRKFVASHNQENAFKTIQYFEAAGWPCVLAKDPESLEFMKVMSNVHMGLEIAWRQEVERMMEDLSIEPTDYEEWEKSYRDGYLALQDWNLIRPIMKPDPIGGHCILQCVELLREKCPSSLLDFIVASNEEIKNERFVSNGKSLNGRAR